MKTAPIIAATRPLRSRATSRSAPHHRNLRDARRIYHDQHRLKQRDAEHDPLRYGGYFPSYLLKCLQDWFDRHGDDLYSELKHIRNALDQLLASARFADRVQRHARQLDLLVSTHRLLECRRASRTPTAANDQLTLF